MKGVHQRVSRERQINLGFARWAAALLRKYFRKPLPPDVLEKLQTENWGLRLATDTERAELKRRRGQRAARISRRFGSSPAVHEARRRHDRALRELEGVLDQRESILYQIGDACAWVVLRGRTRLLAPLYGNGKQHALLTGIGLAGPIYVASTAHTTDNFLVALNDLTRCLCTGDLTAVWSNREWRHPATFEVKTTEPDDKGRATITLMGVSGGWQEDVELVRDFQAQLGFTIGEPDPMTGRAMRQWEEIMSHAELMHHVTATGIRPLGANGRTLWAGIERVLRAALRTGYSYDLLESGVYMLAARNGESDDLAANFGAVLSRWRDDVMPAGAKVRWGRASTSELATQAAWAPIVPPVLLWRIASDLGAYVLANELVLTGLVRDDVWSTVFAGHGIEREIDPEGNWHLRRGNAVVTFGRVEVMKIRAGVVFSGISPRAVAEAVNADLTTQVALHENQPIAS